MSNSAELISTLTYAITEVSCGMARLPDNFGLLVARFLQATPLNYSAATQVVAANTHRIYISDFKDKDWFLDVYIKDDFSFRIDGPYEMSRDVAECTEEEMGEATTAPEHDIAGAMSTLADALQADPSYAWSWQSNLAMAIVDELGVSRQAGNKAAARIMQHVFKVDVTQMKEYKDIISFRHITPRYVPNEGIKDTSVAQVEEIPDNVIHITVTGFQPNSGAEALAQRLPLFLIGGGFTHEMNIADTTLEPSEIGPLPSDKKTHVLITGVESRYHTDMVGDGEEAVDECEPDYGFDQPDLGEDCDGIDDSPREPFGCAVQERPRMTMRLKLDDNDPDPVSTIEYFRGHYPEANLEVEYKVDQYLTDCIHKQARAQVDQPDDGSDEPAGLVMQKPVHLLSDPSSRRNAYLFKRNVDEGVTVALMHVDIDDPEFDVEQVLGEGWLIVHAGSLEAFRKVLGSIESALEYADEIYCNNVRWLNKFGDGEKIELRHHEGPFTLFHIAQGSIPKEIYAHVEDAWTAFQDVRRLPSLAEVLGDPSIVIDAKEYVEVTRGGCMVVREHPRLEELFLTFLKFKATQNPLIDRWIKSFGK